MDSMSALSSTSPTVPTLGADRLPTAVRVADGQVLAAGTAVMHQSVQVTESVAVAGPDRDLQRVQEETSAHMVRRPSADDLREKASTTKAT